MKPFKQFLLPILFLTSLSAAATAQDFSFGAGLAYGTEISQPGFKVDAVLGISDRIRASSDLVIYLTEELDDNIDADWLEINGNGHYLFYEDEGLTVYAISGVNFTRLRFDYPEIDTGFGILPGTTESRTEWGLNIGSGLEYQAGFFSLVSEVKYVLSEADQLVISAGLRVPF